MFIGPSTVTFMGILQINNTALDILYIIYMLDF